MGRLCPSGGIQSNPSPSLLTLLVKHGLILCVMTQLTAGTHSNCDGDTPMADIHLCTHTSPRPSPHRGRSPAHLGFPEQAAWKPSVYWG